VVPLLCLIVVQGGIAFGKKAKPSTPMDKLMHNDYMTGNTSRFALHAAATS
jgi:hypothetical protein